MKTQRQLLLVVLLAMVVTSCRKSKEEAATPAPPTGGGFVECPEFVIDIDENEYPVVRIGNQCWMAADLRTTRYKNGTNIPNVIDANAWLQMNSGAWCNYDNNSINGNIYGKLYNWHAAANPNVCPQGWHVPSDAEWSVLVNQLGGEGVAGGKLKSTTHWSLPNEGATNETGFTALPGGYRDAGGGFFNLGEHGIWWSSTQTNPYEAWFWEMYSSVSGIYRVSDEKEEGVCIRCIRD